ncbi:helix-turn-helix domain-containing protein [Amycolatopsis sp. NBC_01488]|uniref:helix-turn-helix domain-containing protein n=1 Tax=Amycolatopsis sp. NBC_01488 TaxID=2903563 RepID=UPI002E2C241F|nr:helix-turn-helix transcriptional regulator [Amycolatopsis sp. NBC_01488]
MNDNELGHRIRLAREQSKLTLRQLAGEVGVDHGYIAHLEKGSKKNPSAELLQKIAEALHVDPSELLECIGIKPSSILPKPRDYFLRALGATEEEADMLAGLVQYLHKQKEAPSEEAEQERHDCPD